MTIISAPMIRTLAVCLLGLAVASGVYLWAVRGEALLMDLAAGFSGMMCF